MGEVLFQGLLEGDATLGIYFDLVGCFKDGSVEGLMDFRCLGYKGLYLAEGGLGVD